MEIELLDRKLKGAGKVEVPDELFARAWNEALVHRLAVAHASNGRQGTRKQKSRAEVKHTTKKLFRQKGTGRARAGMRSSPIRRGGGRAFPASPSDNVRKGVNRKEFRAGMAAVLSQLVRENRLAVAEEIASDEIKTKPCAQMIAGYASGSEVLFVDTEFEHRFAMSTRNLRAARSIELGRLLSTDLLRSPRTVLSRRALDEIVKAWA